MSEKNNEEPNKNPNDSIESNEDGDIVTWADLLNEQREIDEVTFDYIFDKHEFEIRLNSGI